MKVCLVCSYGGHLAEMMRLMEAFEDHDAFLVTYDGKSTRGLQDSLSMKVHLIRNLYSNRVQKLLWFWLFLTMFVVAFEELKILFKDKPQVIISDGSEIAIPIFYMAKLFRKHTIFIETIGRPEGLSGTGKIVYPVTDLFLVQWEETAERYRKARYEGYVL